MKRRRTYTRDFKISVIREVESGKTLAQVSRENEIHPSLVVKWKKEYFRDPENAFRGNGKAYKEQARMAELERYSFSHLEANSLNGFGSIALIIAVAMSSL